MVATSYNGWSLITSADIDNTPIPGTDGVTMAPGFRKGDVAYVFQQFFSRFNERVEKLVKGWCWGFVVKKSANSAALNSCHGSGTAGDADAPNHPNGKRNTFSKEQVAQIRQLIAEFDNVIYWGGDAWGNGTPDEMHFEIREGVTEEQVAALAAKLRGAPVPAARPVPATPAAPQAPDPRATPRRWQAWYNAYNFVPALLPIIKPLADAWGPQSDAALRKVQARYGLVVDGIPGPQTRALLYRLGWRG